MSQGSAAAIAPVLGLVLQGEVAAARRGDSELLAVPLLASSVNPRIWSMLKQVIALGGDAEHSCLLSFSSELSAPSSMRAASQASSHADLEATNKCQVTPASMFSTYSHIAMHCSRLEK